MKRIFLAAALTVTLGVAVGAGAHKLEHDKAIAKTERWAKRSCALTPDCVRYAGRYCYPLSMHKRRCTAQVIRRLADGDLVQCQTQLVWRLPKDKRKPRLAHVGTTRCD